MNEQKLRVWWIPQVPMKMFTVDVPNLATAKLMLDTLADYDNFQFENKVKPDYCNAGGLSVLEDGEWNDWYDDDGNSIEEFTMADCQAYDKRLTESKQCVE